MPQRLGQAHRSQAMVGEVMGLEGVYVVEVMDTVEVVEVASSIQCGITIAMRTRLPGVQPPEADARCCRRVEPSGIRERACHSD